MKKLFILNVVKKSKTAVPYFFFVVFVAMGTGSVVGAQGESQEEIIIYGAEATHYKSYSGMDAGVRFKLKNTSEMTAINVRVTFYFKDAKGVIIHEKSFNPVSSSIIRDDVPLKPNYVWELGKGKYYPVENMPSEWEPGSFDVEIVSVEYESLE